MKGLSGILPIVTNVVWKHYSLVFFIILRISEEGTISVSVLNPNTSCSLSVRSVLVYSGRYPNPLIFSSLYSRSLGYLNLSTAYERIHSYPVQLQFAF